MKPIYLDYAATTPTAPEVIEVMRNCLSHHGNASSAHCFGFHASNIIEESRHFVAQLINAHNNEIIFTSGATESNNLALLGLINYMERSNKKHIITSATEHKAVLDAAMHMDSIGFDVTYLTPDRNGLISIGSIEQAIRKDTAFISIMHVNNETGVIQNIQSIGELIKNKDIIFHVDAAQSAGKLSIDTKDMFIDLLSISAHKFYGPQGIGALYINSSINNHLSPLIHGGGQEAGLRPGTYATHQIAGLGKAAEIAINKLPDDLKHASKTHDAIVSSLADSKITTNNDRSYCLPNIMSLSMDGVDSTTLMTCLQDLVAISSGSACSSGTIEPSHVLSAMGIKDPQLASSFRISFGRFSTFDEVTQGVNLIKNECKRINDLI